MLQKLQPCVESAYALEAYHAGLSPVKHHACLSALPCALKSICLVQEFELELQQARQQQALEDACHVCSSCSS